MASLGLREFLSELNRKQRELALHIWPFLLGFIVLSSGSFIACDLYAPESAGLYFATAMIAWAGDYIILVLLLQRGRLVRAGQGSGVGTYVVIGIAMGFAIGLALIALIVPGLYLMMRWLPVYARARVTEDWIGNTLRWSWQATEAFQKPLSIALLGPVFCYFVSYLPFALDNLQIAISYELSVVVTDVLLPIGATWLTVLGVASYAVLTAVNGEEAEVGVA